MASEFGIDDILTALALNTALSDYEVQNHNEDDNQKWAERTNRTGDVLEEQEYDNRKDFSFDLIINSVPVTGTQLILGGVGYGAAEPKLVLTQLRVTQVADGFPILGVTGHLHVGTSNSHTAQAYTITLPDLDEGVNDVFSLSGVISEDITRVELTASVQHLDRMTRQGAFLIGRSYKCRLDEAVTYFQNASVASATGWNRDGSPITKVVDGYVVNQIRHHKFQAKD